MPEIWASVWATPGLAWIALAAFVAGTVRGFSGFGTGLVYLPVAAQFLPPFWALITIALMDIAGPAPNLRRAWRDADRGDLARLCIGAGILLPVGLLVLGFVAPDVFRLAVSGLAIALLIVLVSGWRWYKPVTARMVYGIGGAAGFLGGVAGLPGPPVILFYMARPLGAAVTRANTLLFLLAYGIFLTGTLAAYGRLAAVPVVLGLALTAPNKAGNWLGGRLFVPGHETLYRRVAYTIIAASALSGLPVWG